MQETFNLFRSGTALEVLCGWSDNLKNIPATPGRVLRSCRSLCLVAFDYIQAKLVSAKTPKWCFRGQSRWDTPIQGSVPISVGQTASYFSAPKSATEVAAGKDALEP